MKYPAIKITGALLILYSIYAGLTGPVPRLDILNETIRNLYFHVPLWFAMLFQMGVSWVFALKYLNGYNPKFDIISSSAAITGGMFALPGILTGSVWANFTWGKPWVAEDPKLQGVMASALVYSVYYLLRALIPERQTKARIAAVYNIFAFVMTFVFILIYPRMNQSSLHPGNGGNPAFGKYDLDSNMRLVFYPAVLGWIIISAWLCDLISRHKKINYYLENNETIA